MNLPDLDQYECALFADRKTMDEALNYSHLLARASDHPAAVLGAVYVVLNTAIRLVREARELPPEST